MEMHAYQQQMIDAFTSEKALSVVIAQRRYGKTVAGAHWCAAARAEGKDIIALQPNVRAAQMLVVVMQLCWVCFVQNLVFSCAKRSRGFGAQHSELRSECCGPNPAHRYAGYPIKSAHGSADATVVKHRNVSSR